MFVLSKKIKKGLFVVALSGIVLSAAQAQPSSLSFERYGYKDGLPNSITIDFARDSFGFLWVLTENWMSRFDGYQFKNYLFPNRWGGSSYLMLDGKNQLWVTDKSELYLFDRSTEKFIKKTLPDSTRGDQMCFLPSKDTAIWFRREQGLYRIAPSTDSAQLVWGKVPNRSRDYGFQDSRGRFWFNSCDDELTRYDPQKDSSVVFPYPWGCAHRFWQNPHTGMIWASTWTHGIVEIDPETGASNNYKTPDQNRNIYYDLFLFPEITGDSLLWVRSIYGDEGCWLFDLKRKRFLKNYPNEPFNPQSLPGGQLGSMWRDAKEGILWTCGFMDGIAQYNPRKQQILHRILGNKSQELEYEMIQSVRPHSFEQSVMLWDKAHVYLQRTNETGFSKLDYSSLGWTYKGYLFLPKLCRDAKDQLWIFTPTGLYQMDETRWKIVKAYKLPMSPSPDGTNGFIIDPKGDFWLAKENELWGFKPSTGRFKCIARIDPSNAFWDGRIAPDGAVWFRSLHSLWRFDPSTGQKREYIFPEPTLSPRPYWFYGIRDCDFEKESNMVWVTSTWGLYRLNPADGTYAFFPLTTATGYPNCRRARLDRFGKIWVATYNGVIRFDPITGTQRLLTQSDGLIKNWQEGLTYIGDRIYLFSGHDIFEEINPTIFDQPEHPIRTFITGFRIFGQPQVLDWAQAGTVSATIRSEQNVIEIEYAAPDFEAARRLMFEYRLEGFGTQWLDNGNRRSVGFTNLAPGHYVFRVRARHDYSQQWSEEAVFKLYVRPAFYQTIWFRLSLIFLALGTVGFASAFYYRYRLRTRLLRLEKMQRESEKQQLLLQQELALRDQRDQISQGIHDDLGTGLSSIRITSDRTLKNFEAESAKSALLRIASTASQLDESRRALSWATDPEMDTLGSWLARLRTETYTLFEGAETAFEPNIPIDFQDAPLSGFKRLHLMRAVKEALNNALRHAQAATISLQIEILEKELVVQVRDDGKGFDFETESNKGKGLKGIQKHMATVGGHAEWNNGEKNGTILRLVAPLDS